MTDPLDTSGARERILARLRSAQRTGDLPPAEERAELPPSSLDGAPRAELLERFALELEKLGVALHRARDEREVASFVRELLGEGPCLSWARAELPYELGAALADLPLHEPGTARDAAAACTVGLTGVHAALAETGSLVCISSPSTPRTASLLPPRHVAVVRPEQVLSSLGAFLRSRAESFPASSAVNVITGPSRTADIELQLTLGVHGPGVVIVVLGPARDGSEREVK